MRSLSLIVLVVIFISSSCKKDNSEINPAPNFPVDTNQQTSYVLISNEGPFLAGTGTITRYDRISNTYQKKIFETVNNYPLGNIVQSVEAFNNKVYVVVHNANKIVVAEDSTFKSIAEIDNIALPRYFIPIDSAKAYVTCWDDRVAVIDLQNYSVVNYIDVGTGPERMLKVNDKVFVLNIGGFVNDSTVSVIDCHQDIVDTTIFVGARPSGIVLDVNSNIWIMCSGKGYNGFPFPGDSPGKLLCIDPENYSVIKDLAFSDASEHPDKLVINQMKDVLFYLYPGGIFKYDINSNNLEVSPFITHINMFYSLGYDHREKLIYASDPLDYTQQGVVYKFDGVDGTLVDQHESGVIPGHFYFN